MSELHCLVCRDRAVRLERALAVLMLIARGGDFVDGPVACGWAQGVALGALRQLGGAELEAEDQGPGGEGSGEGHG